MLDRLPHDVFVYICVEFLEVSEVVNLERVSKYFVELRRSHYLWASFLQDLDIDHAPELPHNVDASSLPPTEIRAMVIRALQGFENWHRKGGPFYVRKVVIPRSLFDSETDPSEIVKVKLVPGGLFLILHRRIGILELWDVTTQALLASYDPFPESTRTAQNESPSSPISLEFEVTFAGKSEEIAIFTKASRSENLQGGNDRSAEDIMTVAMINTENGAVSEVYRESIDKDASFQEMDFYGDHAVAVMQDNKKLFLLNWKTRQRVTIVKEANSKRISRASVLRGYLITVDGFDGSPLTISAFHLPHIFEPPSHSGISSRNPEISFEDFISPRNTVSVPRLDDSDGSWERRTKRLSAYSLTFTNWKRKKDRHLYIRLLTFYHTEVQVSTMKLHIGSEEMGKPLLTLENISPRVDTECMPWVQLQGDLKRMTSSGRVLLVRPNRATRIRHRLYAPYSPFCWGSTWALSSEERLESIMSSTVDKLTLESLIPQQSKEGEECFACDKMILEEYSGAVYTGPFKTHSQVENIHVWYSS